MAATPYKPISWTDRSLTQEKLQQMANNDQWLFENTPRMRYTGSVTRDTGIKIIAGRIHYAPVQRDWQDATVNFGSFFSAACKPVVTATVSDPGGGLRKLLSLRGFGGEIDYRGFVAHIIVNENYPGGPVWHNGGGWVHWIAVGF